MDIQDKDLIQALDDKPFTRPDISINAIMGTMYFGIEVMKAAHKREDLSALQEYISTVMTHLEDEQNGGK